MRAPHESRSAPASDRYNFWIPVQRAEKRQQAGIRRDLRQRASDRAEIREGEPDAWVDVDVAVHDRCEMFSGDDCAFSVHEGYSGKAFAEGGCGWVET